MLFRVRLLKVHSNPCSSRVPAFCFIQIKNAWESFGSSVGMGIAMGCDLNGVCSLGADRARQRSIGVDWGPTGAVGDRGR